MVNSTHIAQKVPLASTSYFAGMVGGGLIISYFADRNGRRLSLLFSSLLTGIAVLVMGLSYRIEVIFVLFTLAGAGFSSMEIISLVYASEVSGKRFRNHSGVALVTVWGVSQVILGFIYPFFNNWRYIFIFIIGSPCIFSFLLVYLFFDETPSFYVINHNYEVIYVLQGCQVSSQKNGRVQQSTSLLVQTL